MPNLPESLTDEQKQQIKDWIDGKVGSGGFTCSLCTSAHWIIGDHLVSSPIFSKGLHLGGPVYPFAMLICSVCAYTVFLNSVMIGVSPSQTETKDKDKDKEGEGQKKEAEKKEGEKADG